MSINQMKYHTLKQCTMVSSTFKMNIQCILSILLWITTPIKVMTISRVPILDEY